LFLSPLVIVATILVVALALPFSMVVVGESCVVTHMHSTILIPRPLAWE